MINKNVASKNILTRKNNIYRWQISRKIKSHSKTTQTSEQIDKQWLSLKVILINIYN